MVCFAWQTNLKTMQSWDDCQLVQVTFWSLFQSPRVATGRLFRCHFITWLVRTWPVWKIGWKQIRNPGTQQNRRLMKCGWNSPPVKNKMVWFGWPSFTLRVTQWQSVRPRGLLDTRSIGACGCRRSLLKILFRRSPVAWKSAAVQCSSHPCVSWLSLCRVEMKVCREAQFCKLK